MVQRKVVASKLGIQVEHVINKSDKLFVTNMKLSSSNQNIDEKIRVSDMKKKKIKKMKSIKLSDIEALQSSPSAPSSSKKQHPNYMKPTSSSHAKKELFSVSDFKNSPRKFSSDSSKATTSVSSSASNKKSTKSLTRSSSLSLVRTLTKRTSFKACRKSPRASICGEMKEKSHRATCSSTLKDSKFPEYLMLSSGGTELEGSSVMKVCPYTYCSLNGHHHAADFPPLKSFISSRRRHLKTQKRAKLEAPSPRRLKDFDVEKNDFDAKPAYDEIGMEDMFIDIYANEKDVESIGSEEIGKTDFLKEVEDQEVESTIEDDCIAEGEEGVNVIQAIPSITDEDHQTNCSHDHEEMSMESYCSDEEEMEDVDNDMNDSDSMKWEEEQFYEFDHEKDDADSSSSSDNDSKVESLSESSHDMSVTWLDDILNSYYEDILVDQSHQTLKEAKLEETTYVEEQEQPYDRNSSVLEDTSESTETQETSYPSRDMVCDKDNSGEEYENQVDDVANCSMKKELGEDTNDNIQCQNMSETCKVDETIEDSYSSQENTDIDNINNNENQIELLEVVEKDEGEGNKLKSKSCIYDEEKETSENWKGLIRGKRCVEDEDEEDEKSFNPREPNFLPLEPEEEGEKVDLKHQMMDERKNADEWMIDCALRQVVTKLAPARKKKVALLVEAFESVMPIQKFGSHLRNNSGFAHSRHIQACS